MTISPTPKIMPKIVMVSPDPSPVPNIDIDRINVNHRAYCGLNCITLGMCIPCWIGACCGCNACPTFNEY